MLQKQLVPKGHVLIIDNGMLRAIPQGSAPGRVMAHDVGVITGETANAVCTPALMLIDALKGAGRAVAASQFGQSTKYGWDRAERRKAVFSQSRSLREADIRALAGELVTRGVITSEQALKLPENQIRKLFADMTVPDPYIDEETYVGQQLEEVAAPKGIVPFNPSKSSEPQVELTGAFA